MTATAKERTRLGKARRELVSRAALAKLNPKERHFDPIDVLRTSTEGRMPQLLPVKYARMKVSPFAFFRGAVSIMASDLGRLANSGLHVQLCGDAHVQNLGSFATPDGKVVFDLNDFDETIRGPWEWDVKRMATSIVLAGEESGHDRSGCGDAAEMFAESYCRFVGEFSELPILQVVYFNPRCSAFIASLSVASHRPTCGSPLRSRVRFARSQLYGFSAEVVLTCKCRAARAHWHPASLL